MEPHDRGLQVSPDSFLDQTRPDVAPPCWCPSVWKSIFYKLRADTLCLYNLRENLLRKHPRTARQGALLSSLVAVPLLGTVLDCSLEATPPDLTEVSSDPDMDPKEEPFIQVGKRDLLPRSTVARWLLCRRAVANPTLRRCPTRYLAPANSSVPRR